MASSNNLSGAVAWWRKTTRRPALFWVLVSLTVMIGVDGVVLLAWQAPAPISVGALPEGALVRRNTTGPQPAPVAIQVPAIGVSSPLESLTVDSSGVLGVPENYAHAGWWSAGPAPGADGAAVIVGHMDSDRGAAVFHRLRQSQPGGEIIVRRADGSSVSFVVDAVRQYDKDQIPTRVIYGATPTPSLRLITCGGAFDRRTRSYRDNVVVFAHLATGAEKVASA